MGDIRAGLEELKLDGTLFANVKFYVSGEGDPKILSLLQEGGAERSNYFSDFVTHLIAGYEALENDISAAKDLYEIPAVTQNWILYSVKCKKLLPVQYFSPEENQLFSNVRACISQVSRTDSKALWAMITLQGGNCKLRLDRHCTHLITGRANGAKYEVATRHHLHIVTPDWVTECTKRGSLVNEVEFHPRLVVYPSPNSSTALITGFMDEDNLNNTAQEEQDGTNAVLEQLKQRMPWNQPNQPNISNAQGVNSTSAPAFQSSNSRNVVSTQQQHFSRSVAATTSSISSPVTSQNLINQNWIPSNSQANNLLQMKSPLQSQIQELQSQVNQQMNQQVNQQSNQQGNQQVNQQVNQQGNQQVNQQVNQQANQQVNQQVNQQLNQQVNQQLNQQVNQQVNLQMQQQMQQIGQQIGQQQQNFSLINQQQIQQQNLITSPQQINPQMSQMQITTQQQLLASQQKQLMTSPQMTQPQQISPQNQITQQMALQQQLQGQQLQGQQLQSQQITGQQLQGQQITGQQLQGQQITGQQLQGQQITGQQLQVQQITGQQLQGQQMTGQQLQNQQITGKPLQGQQITGQQLQGQQLSTQQLNQLNQTPQQQLTHEQRQQLILLQQQQQKIQQISQQLQQSAPQASQQFVIRDGQLQQQSPNQQLINPTQQSFIVQRDPQWQQQQYHLQLQRQQQQQQLGQQRPGGQWAQQPPQPPRQLIQLDAQTHQQLQQMDPQQRAQFIQKIQKQRTLIMHRQMQSRQAQQGPHIAVIRSPGKPGQPGLQWVQQPRAQMMGPQVTPAAGQKPMHAVQPPALAPINSPNQVIVQTAQPVQGPQPPQAAAAFQQGQLTPQQIAQLHLQKQQQMVRLQQLQHLQQQQQQQQQQSSQQEPQLAALPGNNQISPEQQLVVNAKTKTALANMLTNRLQGGATEGSAAGQLRLMTAQHRPPPPPSQDPQLLAAYQRRTLGNMTNGAPPGAQIKMQYTPAMTQPKAQFYGHNPNLKLPQDLFLLGCIFVIVEYDTQNPNEVSVWKQVIERHGGEVEPQYCARATHVLSITQKHPIVVQALREGKRCVSAHWLSDVVNKQQVLPPWHALHFPTHFSLTELPCSKHIISLSGFEGEERSKVKIMLETLGAKLTVYFSKHNTLLVCRRPDGPKYKKAREWQINVVNAQWLTDLLCGQMSALHQIDAPKYQQFSLGNPFRLDYSLVPQLMSAWKMPINITQESYDKVKQVGQGPNARKYKKPRLDVPFVIKEPHLLGLDEPIVVSNPDPPPPDKQPRILFSGIDPRKHAKRIRELGGAMAASWRDATHLIMSAPVRTVKFLCCLSRCKYIVSLQWLMDCSAKNTFLDETAYILGDPEFEKNYGCNIQKALSSPNRGTVLKGKTFYVTPSVIPAPTSIAEIIESAGGTMDKTRKSLAQIQELNSTELNYIIVTHENDLHLLADVLRANINIFTAEIVMGAIARQCFKVEDLTQ